MSVAPLPPPPQQCSQCGELRPIPFVFVACAGNPVAPHTHNYRPLVDSTIHSTYPSSSPFADVLEKLENLSKQNEKIEKKMDETSKMDEKLAMDVVRLEKKVDETNKKRRSIAIGDISSGSWKEIEARGYQITPHEWTDALTAMLEPSCTVTSSSSSSSCAPFHWDEQQSEPQQIDSYTQYIRDQLKLPRNILLRPAPAHLLDTTSPILPFDVSGTTDLILVERAAIRGLVPASGVRVIIEVKKALTEDSKRAQYQAMLELITADLSSAFCPIALLTDLQDTFIFSWLDWEKERMLRNYIHVLVPPSRSLAFRLLNHLTAQFNSEKDEMKTAADAILEQLPVPISKRRKLSIIPEQRYTDHDDEEEDDEGVHESGHDREWRRPLLLDENDIRPEWHMPTMLEREGLPVMRRKLAQWIRNSPILMKGFITHDSQGSLPPLYQSMFS